MSGIPVISRIFSRRKRIKDLPNLHDCHCCGSSNEKLHALDSHWRIVLLCETCLRTVRNAETCSYCFEKFPKDERVFSVGCLGCSCRVHPRCLPILRGYLVKSDFDPDFFCIDCCPFLRKPGKIKNNSLESEVFGENEMIGAENSEDNAKRLKKIDSNEMIVVENSEDRVKRLKVIDLNEMIVGENCEEHVKRLKMIDLHEIIHVENSEDANFLKMIGVENFGERAKRLKKIDSNDIIDVENSEKNVKGVNMIDSNDMTVGEKSEEQAKYMKVIDLNEMIDVENSEENVKRLKMNSVQDSDEHTKQVNLIDSNEMIAVENSEEHVKRLKMIYLGGDDGKVDGATDSDNLARFPGKILNFPPASEVSVGKKMIDVKNSEEDANPFKLIDSSKEDGEGNDTTGSENLVRNPFKIQNFPSSSESFVENKMVDVENSEEYANRLKMIDMNKDDAEEKDATDLDKLARNSSKIQNPLSSSEVSAANEMIVLKNSEEHTNRLKMIDSNEMIAAKGSEEHATPLGRINSNQIIAIDNSEEYATPLKMIALNEMTAVENSVERATPVKMIYPSKNDGEGEGAADSLPLYLAITKDRSTGVAGSPIDSGSCLPNRFFKTYFKRSLGKRKDKNTQELTNRIPEVSRLLPPAARMSREQL